MCNGIFWIAIAWLFLQNRSNGCNNGCGCNNNYETVQNNGCGCGNGTTVRVIRDNDGCGCH